MKRLSHQRVQLDDDDMRRIYVLANVAYPSMIGDDRVVDGSLFGVTLCDHLGVERQLQEQLAAAEERIVELERQIGW